MADKTGKKISHYKVLTLLGRGGMSEVYKARDMKLDRYVALKFLAPDASAEQEIKNRFIREAQTASALEHNHICTIFEIDETRDGEIFIAMAHCEGGSLKDRIAGGTLSWEEAVEFAIQVALGLAKAHEHNIIHRDIKPANVMLTRDGVVKIVDFGLAKLTNSTRITKTSEIVGTPAYMSPEQARCFEVDHRSDIWSLGVMLYEMLARNLPFRGDNAAAMLYAIVKENPAPLQVCAPQVPARLGEIVARALAKDLEQRYQSAHDVIADLRQVKDGRGAGVLSVAGDVETVTIVAAGGDAPPHAVLFPHEPPELAQQPQLNFPQKLRLLTTLMLAAEEEREMPRPGNPYLNRLMIQNPQDFYGRISELARIYERIKAVRPQSMSIVGVRRIGKSSLLQAIHHAQHRRKHLPHPEEYVFVFTDFQGKRNAELPEIFRYIYNELEKEYRGHLKITAAPDYEGMKQVINLFQEAGLKLIFLWDEFESVTRNPKVGPDFYGFFRSLANNHNVAYITSSADQLQRLCHAKEISDSPFFNIFTNQRLGPFKPEEARQLIVEPSEKEGRPLAPHADFILDIAGYFPFFVQIACSALFTLAAEGRIDAKKAKEMFLEEALPHFREYWEKFNDAQRAVAVALAKKRSLPREHAFALKDLMQEGWVKEGRLFSSLFAEFVREHAGREAPWWKLW